MSIPLSYTTIDSGRLSDVFSRYAEMHHQRIILDFERCLAGYAPGKVPVAVNSGTSAIHLALKAVGVEQGDYVVLPTFTYIATVNPVLYQGAIPVFVDSEAATWNMDPDILRGALIELVRLNKKPKAIIIVHTYGMPGDISALREIANHFEIPIVEDAAEAIGSSYSGTHAGELGDVGVLSFNNNKILTTFGGGAVLCSDDIMGKKVLFWATQSREALPYYVHREVGYNYRMSPLAAANGLAHWDDLSKLIHLRREIRHRYLSILEPQGWIGQRESFGKTNGWLSTVVQTLSSHQRLLGSLFAEFGKAGIEVRPLWNPLHSQPMFNGCMFFGGNVAKGLFESGLCLPSSSSLTATQQERVVRIIANV